MTPFEIKNQISDYNSLLFSSDKLNEKWISDCRSYLNFILEGKVKGKTVIDYGFGRGNWSLAFQSLGAYEVYAFDAASTAVKKFKAEINSRKIKNIYVDQKNTDISTFEIKADIIFLYGIFHHVRDIEKLITCAAKSLKNSEAKIILYSYAKYSWRETLIRHIRSKNLDIKLIKKLKFSLHPNARHRFLDDLTAPIVNFFSTDDINNILKRHSLHINNKIPDFSIFQTGNQNFDFSSHVFTISKQKNDFTLDTTDLNYKNHSEVKTLIDYTLSLIKTNDVELFSVGLFNTWYSQHPNVGDEEKIFYLWQFICYYLNENRVKFPNTKYGRSCKRLLELTINKNFGDFEDQELEELFPTILKLGGSTNYRI